MDREVLSTPLGPMALVVNEHGAIVSLSFRGREGTQWRTLERSRQTRESIERVKRQLSEYFSGERRSFDVTIAPHGTELERRVWSILYAIPYGTTTTYGAIAAQLGLRHGARAVGRANGANPIPIIVPCHRVIGADGSLVGYGGGIAIKETLLRLEGVLLT